MKRQSQFRQGDVLLEKVETIPKGAKAVDKKFIAFGEHSNHGHAVTGDVDVLEDNGESFLSVGPDGKLEHVLISNPDTWTGEHHPIALPPGNYKVIQQREYDPYEKEIRDVRD